MSTTAAEPVTVEEAQPRRRWRGRLAWGLLAFLLVAILAIVLFTRASVRRAFPEVNGTIPIAALTGDVEVIRDSMGIPHLYGDTIEDLFLAQGFVHAQDRFYQMDFWRHLSSGRLSEMFGASQLDTDRFLRTMGWSRLAEDQYEAETPEIRSALDAYAAGVNAYLDGRSPADLSFEYTVIDVLNRGYDPEPWSPAESLAWGKVMAWDLGGNLLDEIQRAMALGSVSAAQVAQLYPPYPRDRHPFIVTEPGDVAAIGRDAAWELPPAALDELAAMSAAIEALRELTPGGVGEGIGSNSWVVAGEHTPTGAPMLMNDPHLGVQMPSIWYQVGLHCRQVTPDCPLDVAGFSFAGVPGVIIGRNADIAWGFTNLGPDVQDLYVERVNPENPFQYELDGTWVDMEVRTETIEVAGGDDEELTIASTVHGPIISGVYGLLDDFDDSGVDTPDPYALALRWTALDEGPSIAGPILAFNTASTFDEFRDAARLFAVPAQNLVYADVEGNIGYQAPGRIPIRSQGDGTYPVPGWTGEYEWEGYIPFEELPWSLNPESGWIVTANNAVIDDFPHPITEDWAYGYRARRIVDLVTSNPGLALDDHGTIQLDGYDLNAEFLRPLVLDAVRRGSGLHGVEGDAVDALASWDLQNFAHSTGAAVWNATWRAVLELTFHDDLAEDQWPIGGSRWFEAVRGLTADPADPFWDDRTTGDIESRDDILDAAFRAGIAELRDELGSDVTSWTWGDVHTITFRNPSLGSTGIGLIDDRFNRGPYPVSGSTSVPNAVGWIASEGYEAVALPSLRMLVDLSDASTSYAIHSTGQSGHTDHPHYDDMIPLWLAGGNVPFLFERSDIEADAEATLLLTP